MTKKRKVLLMKKMSKGMRYKDWEKREDGRQFKEDPSSDPCTPMRIRALVCTSGAVDPRSTDPSSDPFEKVLGSAMIRVRIQLYPSNPRPRICLSPLQVAQPFFFHFTLLSSYIWSVAHASDAKRRIIWFIDKSKTIAFDFLNKIENWESWEGGKGTFHQLLCRATKERWKNIWKLAFSCRQFSLATKSCKNTWRLHIVII